MSSAFERMQKLAEEKRLREKNAKRSLEVIEVNKPVQPIPSNDIPSYPIQSGAIIKPLVPAKDYQRVPNSITRDAVPNKLFKGTSKSTYDALYLKTRGAINPVRTIKATKRELMKWIGISHVTIFKHLKHLESVGLLKIEQQLGSHEGSIYEVFIPEEIQPMLSNDSQYNPILSNPTQPNLSNDNQSNKLVSVPYNNIVLDRMGDPIENKTTYTDSKTLLKHKTIDDEAFALFIENFQTAAREITGKNLSKRDAENLKELSDLLILELKMAARRTNNISSIPAFLTEVLRRKLSAAQANTKSSKTKIDTVGKSDSGNYEIKPLDAKGREAALEQLREFANDDFIQDFKKWYTPNDWQWLMKELQKDSDKESKKTAAEKNSV